jgi:glycerol-3-phosphate acyltransferase PlsY
MIIFGQNGLFGVAQPVLIEMYIVTFLLAALAFWKHRENIKRLIHKKERKTYLSHKNKE